MGSFVHRESTTYISAYLQEHDGGVVQLEEGQRFGRVNSLYRNWDFQCNVQQEYSGTNMNITRQSAIFCGRVVRLTEGYGLRLAETFFVRGGGGGGNWESVWIVGHSASVSVQLISKFRPSRHTNPRRNQNHIGLESKIHACSST